MSTPTMEPPKVEALQLLMEPNEEGYSSPDAPVRWCISRETAEYLQAQDVVDPHMLIVIENDGNETGRYLVPLKNELCFVQFRSPGINTLHGTIVWGRGHVGKKELEKLFLKKGDYGVHETSLIETSQPGVQAMEREIDRLEDERYEARHHRRDNDEVARLTAEIDRSYKEFQALRLNEPKLRTLRTSFQKVRCIGSEATYTVEVPEEMFAKPPRWMQWLGSRYRWSSPPRDQCQLRRRALITVGSAPFLLFASAMIVLLMTAILTVFYGVVLLGVWLLGSRNVDYSWLRNPVRNDPRDVWEGRGRSIWWTKQDADGYWVPRHPVWYVVNPLSLLAFAVVGLVLYFAAGDLIWIAVSVGSVFVAGLLVLIGAAFAKGPLAEMRKKWAEQQRIEREQNQQKLSKELELLACSAQPRPVSVSALPAEHRTVQLRMRAIKSQVCKPFAK